MLVVLFVIPIILLIVSIALTIKFLFWGALCSTLINTLYYCLFIKVMSGVGHPNSAHIAVNWSREWKGIVICFLASLLITLLLAVIVYFIQSAKVS